MSRPICSPPRANSFPPGLGIALADFEAFEQVQSKASLAELLDAARRAAAQTEIVRSADEFAAERPFPFFVKAAFGTASTGVWRVRDARQRDALLAAACNSTMRSPRACWSRPR